MKIVLLRELNPFFDASASGNRFASLVKGLQERDVTVSLYITGGYSNMQEREKYGRYFRDDKIEIIYLLSTCNHTLWRRRINKYLLSYFTNLYLTFKLKQVLLTQYDYLWLTNNCQILTWFNRNSHAVKNSLIEVNEFHDVYLQPGSITNKAQVKFARNAVNAFLTSIKQIDYFAFMTDTLLQFYNKTIKLGAAYMHLPMTVDLSRFNLDKMPNCHEEYIGFAGSFGNDKDGVNILIRAFVAIAGTYPELELRLAGCYHPDMEDQKRLIREAGLTSRVKYIGMLDRDQIPSFIVNAKVLALARPDSHQAQGGFPTKLGEYLATKTPVCVTKVGEIPNYLEDNVSAFMAEPGDVDSFADALKRALSSEENAHKVGLAGYEVAYKNFNMDVQAKRLKDFLEANLNK